MIYLDYYAAAPLLAQARLAIERALEEGWANASSVHRMGQHANKIVESSRESIARALTAHPSDIVLTSSGTEACNLAIDGSVRSGSIRRIVTTALEHPAVQECIARSQNSEIEIHVIAAQDGALPAIEKPEEIFDNKTLLAMQCINHETGYVLPVESYAQAAKSRGATVFLDAVGAFATQELYAENLNCDMLAVSSPKIGGPAGAGALWMRRGVKCIPLLVGGLQERGRRAGTASPALCAGFAAACDELNGTRSANGGAIRELRDHLEAGLNHLGATLNRASGERAGNVTNVSFEGWRSDWLVTALDLEGVCVSAGAACSAGQEQSSPSVAALFPEQAWRARGALRISLGPGLDLAAIDKTLQAFATVLSRSRPKT